MLKRLIIFIAIIIICVISYKYIYQNHRDISTEEAKFVVTSINISSQFSNNISASEKKYLNKTIEVTGIISEIDSKYLTIDDAVFCQFSQNINSSIKVDMEIKVKGRLIGYDDLLEQVKLDNCTILN